MNKIVEHGPVAERYEFMMNSVAELGDLALSLVAQGRVRAFTKPDTTIVTSVDLALNKRFIELVEASYPDDLVWGEEASNSPKGDLALAEQAWMWTIDPIDGTRGFWRSYQNERFRECTSTVMIAGFQPGSTTPAMGVIHNPFQRQQVTISADQEQTYYQTTEAPAPQAVELQGASPRHLREVRRFEQGGWQGGRPNLDDMQRYIPSARPVKHQLFLGSVALGDVDISAFPGPSHSHDVAPGALIVHNAGGHIETFGSEPYEAVDWRVPVEGVVAAATPELARQLIDKFS